MADAIVLVHQVGGDSWDTTKVRSKRGRIDPEDLKALLAIKTASWVQVGSGYLMICDESAMMNKSQPSVGIRTKNGVQVILGRVALAKGTPDAIFGLTAADEIHLQNDYPWCPPGAVS